MSTYYHFPSEAAMPTVNRMSHESNPGYAEISFEDLHCFPSAVQVLQLRDALEEYINIYITANAEVLLRLPKDSFIAPESDEITAKYRGLAGDAAWAGGDK